MADMECQITHSIFSHLIQPSSNCSLALPFPPFPLTPTPTHADTTELSSKNSKYDTVFLCPLSCRQVSLGLRKSAT